MPRCTGDMPLPHGFCDKNQHRYSLYFLSFQGARFIVSLQTPAEIPSLAAENTPLLPGGAKASRSPSGWCQQLFPLMKTADEHTFGFFHLLNLEAKRSTQGEGPVSLLD